MQAYQREFIEFALDQGALRFGEFTLKSGRVSPYFFNIGLFNSGRSIAQLGRYYAAAIRESAGDFDMLFGPAYKGVPLAVTTAIALDSEYQRDVPYAFNRKEAKRHGEGGSIIGAEIQGKVLIIDDVISSGLSVGESHEIITACGATAAGVVIALDRQERGLDDTSAIDEIRERYGMGVTSIVTLDDVITYLHEQTNLDHILDRMRDYRHRYGTP